MKILILDNYDSFTYNLVHMVRQLTGKAPDVYRNDKIPVGEVAKYDKILLSPGPGLPEESGILLKVIETYAESKSIFGVCLGLQAMAQSFGGRLFNLPEVYHGVASPISVTKGDEPLFTGLPAVFQAGRYHSWVAERKSLPSCFAVTAESHEGHIMAIRHRDYDLSAVQFHPESILTEHGETIVKNWLKY